MLWVWVIAILIVVGLGALLFFRWFQQYRYTDAWRYGELREVTFGFLLWFGGLFGHRVPPPPEAKLEFASRPTPDSGGPPLADQAPNEEQ